MRYFVSFASALVAFASTFTLFFVLPYLISLISNRPYQTEIIGFYALIVWLISVVVFMSVKNWVDNHIE